MEAHCFLPFTTNVKLLPKLYKMNTDLLRADFSHLQGQWTRIVPSFCLIVQRGEKMEERRVKISSTFSKILSKIH
jgi:hypothetical protein